LEALELLLNWEADIESKNRIGSTPLHRASSCGQVAVVKKLLENGGNVEALNRMGSTPLHCAAYGGFVEVARLICEHGGAKYIRRPNMTGMSPLDYAKECKPLMDFFVSYDGKTTRKSDAKQRSKVTVHHIPQSPTNGQSSPQEHHSPGSFRQKNNNNSPTDTEIRGGSFRKKFLDPEHGSFRTKKTVTIVGIDAPPS